MVIAPGRPTIVTRRFNWEAVRDHEDQLGAAMAKEVARAQQHVDAGAVEVADVAEVDHEAEGVRAERFRELCWIAVAFAASMSSLTRAIATPSTFSMSSRLILGG